VVIVTTTISTATHRNDPYREIHDTVLIAALFCLYNKYVDGTNSITPVDETFYHYLGERITNHGYIRLPQGYDHLKK
jgi:hypothetical protein